MKIQKRQIYMIFSISFMVILLSTTTTIYFNTQAAFEEDNQKNHLNADFESWKWSTTEVVSTESTNGSAVPSMAIDTVGNVHIAWYDYTDYLGAGEDIDSFYKRWDITTMSWTTTEVVSTESTEGGGYTVLAVDTAGNVHIAWNDFTDYAGCGTDADIFYKRWEVSTSSWTTTEVVSTESTNNSYFPSIAVDLEGNVHIAWYDLTDYLGAGDDLDVFYKRWEASTSSWTMTEVVSTESTGYSYLPSIAVDLAGNVHIAWYDITNYLGAGSDADIFYKYWNATTASWIPTEVVSTESTGYSYNPSLTVDTTGNVHITWDDLTNYAGSGTDSDIFYKCWNATTASWIPTEVVSTESTGDSYNPSIAVDVTENVYIAWQDGTNYLSAGNDADIFYKCWNATTASWIPTEVVSTESTGDSRIPSLVVDYFGFIHIAWYDSTDYLGAGEDYDIFYKEFIVSLTEPPELSFILPNPTESNAVFLDWNDIFGATNYYIYRSTTYIWSVENLTPLTTTSVSEYTDFIFYAGTYYYVIVAGNSQENSPKSNCQYVTVKLSGIGTWKWTETELVSAESTNGSYYPSIVVDGEGNVHIAWQEEYEDFAFWNVFYKKWDKDSSTWTTAELISTESTKNAVYPSIAVDGEGNVHIVWSDQTNLLGSGTDSDIFYKRWDNFSSSWMPLELVSTESTGDSFRPSIIADGEGNVHIVWEDLTDYAGSGTDRDIFYKYWDKSFSSWATTEVVSTESTSDSLKPSLKVDNIGNIHVIWEDNTDYAESGTDTDIFYKYWDKSSSSWTITEVVSTESIGNSASSSLGVDCLGNAHIAWYDYTTYAECGTDSDIFYKQRDFISSSWSITEVVSTESTGNSAYPSLAIDFNGNVHIAWHDWTDYEEHGTDRDIFYKRWDDKSSSWTLTEVLSIGSSDHSAYPSLCTDYAGVVHVTWVDYDDYLGSGTDYDLFYKQLSGPPTETPVLAPILPNTTESSSIYLDWNDILGATNYYIYRSTSYIWSIDGLTPVATVTTSYYIDTLPSKGIYYYVIVAEGNAVKTSFSNCVYVEYNLPEPIPLQAPELAIILPNPSEYDSIVLDWNDINEATEYYVYRSTNYIWSVESLIPLTVVINSNYIDTLPAEGYYFYVIVATDGIRNSTISNCQYVLYEIPHLQEFTIITSLLASALVISLIVIRRRKNK